MGFKEVKNMFKDVELKEETKDWMAIIIREAKDIIQSHEDKYKTKESLISELNRLFDGWINANKLRVNEVKNKKGIYQLEKY